MNRTDVAAMLSVIESYERRPFPESAVSAWLPLFVQVEPGDAMQAVREWFDQPEPPKAAVGPGPLRRRALEIARVRRGATALAQIEADRSRATRPNAAYLAARAALNRRHAALVA